MSAPVSIEGELTVFTVHALKERLLHAMDQDPQLQIDLCGVSEVDGAGVQLLLATRREALQRGGTLALISAPPQVLEALNLTALARTFDATTTLETEHTA